MKTFLLLCFHFISASGLALSVVAPSEPEEADAWYRSMLNKIEIAENLESKSAKIEILGKIVDNFGSKLDIQPDERWRDTFIKARAALLNIPGHADHFERELESQRNSDKRPHDHFRVWIIADTLRHLPSPETVRVLGEYLSDERDLPSMIDSDTIPPPENAMLSAYSLSRIGLRDAPFAAAPSWISLVYDPEFKECLSSFRIWWEEVKSGELGFSFLGQEVEYRFKPDGTWETTPLAISDEALREELTSPARFPAAAGVPVAGIPASSPPNDFHGPWLAAGAALLIAMAAWIIRRSKNRTPKGE